MLLFGDDAPAIRKLENKDTNLPENMNEYARLLSLNKKIDLLFKKRSKEISSTGKKNKKNNL